jgi:formylmethanofuran dehydrogenase subunit C
LFLADPFHYRVDTTSMMPAGGIRHIGWRLIHPSAYTRTGIKMRSGQDAAYRQDTDTGEGIRTSGGRLIVEGPGVPTSGCVQADLSRCPMCKVLRAVEVLFIGYNEV